MKYGMSPTSACADMQRCAKPVPKSVPKRIGGHRADRVRAPGLRAGLVDAYYDREPLREAHPTRERRRMDFTTQAISGEPENREQPDC